MKKIKFLAVMALLLFFAGNALASEGDFDFEETRNKALDIFEKNDDYAHGADYYNDNSNFSISKGTDILNNLAPALISLSFENDKSESAVNESLFGLTIKSSFEKGEFGKLFEKLRNSIYTKHN